MTGGKLNGAVSRVLSLFSSSPATDSAIYGWKRHAGWWSPFWFSTTASTMLGPVEPAPGLAVS
eukprot:CAMPEP_0176466998 /NCGR_PEP_ID=MMETSP0127-20121128/38215_1 /TAXON_ID=938130 /ORGANISM="Platyophrya macrostoma, Strain WH" /LENGTH=62 /DNA_ID=CAMNT_0017860251 /DNA_START=81 /DNA_END=267 /DNA_ORIENTATION=+